MNDIQMDYMATVLTDIEDNDKCIDYHGENPANVLLVLHLMYGEYSLDFEDDTITNFVNMN